VEISDSIFLFLQFPLKKKKNRKKENIKNLLSSREFYFQNQRDRRRHGCKQQVMKA